jgi:hypothetical protein
MCIKTQALCLLCRYTRFLGNSSDWKQYSDPAWFEANSADSHRVYAWINYASTGCATAMPYICEIPASMFPCYPP